MVARESTTALSMGFGKTALRCAALGRFLETRGYRTYGFKCSLPLAIDSSAGK